MYKRNELKALKQEFWNAFEAYCSAHSKPSNRKKRWLLHRSGVKAHALKFLVERGRVGVLLELSHKQADQRQEALLALDQQLERLSKGFPSPLEIEEICDASSGQKRLHIGVYASGAFDYHRKSDWPYYFRFMQENMSRLEQNFIAIRPFINPEGEAFPEP